MKNITNDYKNAYKTPGMCVICKGSQQLVIKMKGNWDKVG